MARQFTQVHFFLLWTNWCLLVNSYGLISSSQLSTEGLRIRTSGITPELIRDRSLSITTGKTGSLKVRRAEGTASADLIWEPPIPDNTRVTAVYKAQTDDNSSAWTVTTAEPEKGPKVIREVLKSVVHSSMDDMVQKLSSSLQRFFTAQKRANTVLALTSQPTTTTEQHYTSTPLAASDKAFIGSTEIEAKTESITDATTYNLATPTLQPQLPKLQDLTNEDKTEEENLRWLKPILLALLNKTADDKPIGIHNSIGDEDIATSMPNSASLTSIEELSADFNDSTPVIAETDVTTDKIDTDTESVRGNETVLPANPTSMIRNRKPADFLRIIHSTQGDLTVPEETVLNVTGMHTKTIGYTIGSHYTEDNNDTNEDRRISTITTSANPNVQPTSSTTFSTTSMTPCKSQSNPAVTTDPPLIIYGKNGFTVQSKIVTGNPDQHQHEDPPQLQTSNVLADESSHSNSHNPSGLLVQTVLISCAAGFALLVIFALALVIIFYNRPTRKLSSRTFGTRTPPYLDSSRSDVSFVSNDRLIEAYMAVGETIPTHFGQTPGRLKIVTERSSDSILY